MILVKAINEEVSFLKKKEAVFIGALLIISVALCIFVYAVPHGTHGSIQITVDGKLYGTYPLPAASCKDDPDSLPLSSLPRRP